MASANLSSLLTFIKKNNLQNGDVEIKDVKFNNNNNNSLGGKESSKDSGRVGGRKNIRAAVQPLIASKVQEQTEKKKKRGRNRLKERTSIITKKDESLFKEEILTKFIYFFNIRELMILYDVDNNFRNAVQNSEVYQKYLDLRKEFIKENKENENKIIKQIKSKKNDVSNSMIFYEKYTTKKAQDPVQLGMNDALTLFPNKECKYKNQRKNMELFFSKNNELPPLDYDKLDIKLLLKNNAEKIKKLEKKYNLTKLESKIIFNGIVEYKMYKDDQKEEDKENVDDRCLSIPDLKIKNGFSYYVDSLFSLDFDFVLKVDLSNNEINSPLIVKKFSFVLHKYSNSLKILNLSNNNLNDKCVRYLFPSLQENTKLNLLDLSHNLISAEGLSYAETFLTSITSLNTLILNNNILGPIGILSMINYFDQNPDLNLRTLDISYNGITKEGMQHLMGFIINNSKIVSLFIGGNYICDEGIEFLKSVFLHKDNKNKITYLDLQNNNLSKKSAEYLSKIVPLAPSINSLILKNNNLAYAGIQKLINIFDENCKLITLDLTNVGLDFKSIKIISEKINASCQLRQLILNDNDLGKKSCIYIKNILNRESCLKTLNLRNCHLDDNFNLIFKGLAKNISLNTLDLSENNFGLNELNFKEITNCLKENKILKELYLDKEQIANNCMKDLCLGLLENHSLRRISLKNNYFTDKIFKDFIKGIEKSSIIRTIDLDGIQMSPKNLEEIKIALNKNKNNKQAFPTLQTITSSRNDGSVTNRSNQNNNLINPLKLPKDANKMEKKVEEDHSISASSKKSN